MVEFVEGFFFISVVVLFLVLLILDEVVFECVLWDWLVVIYVIDCCCYGWDCCVSDDLVLLCFSMSVGGKVFYVVGLYLVVSCLVCWFCCLVLVFNLYS